MSARFGRNKRRRAREEAAALRAEVGVLKFEARVGREVAAGREAKLRQAQRELDDLSEAVREAFGDRSVLLPPTHQAVDMSEAPDYFQLPRSEPYSLLLDFTEEAATRMTTVDMCHVISTELSRDHWARAEHLFIVDRGERLLAYVLPDRAARSMPRAKLQRDITKVIGMLLAEKMQEGGR